MAVLLPSSSSSGQSMSKYARIGHAAQQLLPEILQDVMALKEPQHLLYIDVRNSNYLSRNLGAHEWKLINDARQNGYENFDIPLTYKLIRNLNLVPLPSRGWDHPTAPISSETTPGDDIERLKRVRNDIVHRGNANMTDAEMNDLFSMFKDVAGRFETFLGKQMGHYVTKFQQLETCCIDEKTEKMYLQTLNELRQKERDLMNKLDDVIMDVNKNTKAIVGINEYVDNIRKDHEVVKNMLTEMKDVDNHVYSDKLEIEDWEKQDAKFVSTNAVTFILENFETCHTMTVTGVPGVGKSATVRHVALLLRKKGYTVLPCRKPSDILKQYKEGRNQVFVVEDVCGSFTLIPNEVNKWVKAEKSIEIILKQSKSKILLTTKLQVYLEREFKSVKLFTKCVCNLSLEELALSLEQKVQIARKYCNNLFVFNEVRKWIETATFLPVTCLFCSMYEDDSTFDVQTLLRNPFMFFKNEWDKLWKQNDKTKFCALLFLVIFNGSVTEQSMSDTKKNKLIFEVCNLDRGTSRYKIMDQLDSLSRTYVKKQGDQFTVIHSTIMDSLCRYFGDACNQRFQKALLLCADDKVISERTQLESLKVAFENFTIVITEQNEALYFDRIYEEIEKCNVIGVICNRQIHLELYRNKLITAMRTLDKKVIGKFFNTKDSISGLTALWMACHLGYLKLIFFILKFVKDISEYENDWLPLHASIKCDNNKLLKSLLVKGAGINQKNEMVCVLSW